MEMTFVSAGRGKEIIQMDDARIVYRNFSGVGGKFNREGDRNFAVVIPTREMADELLRRGWNVKIKPPREDGEDEFMTMAVKVKFNDIGPNVYLVSGNRQTRLDEESVGCLDDIDILRVDLDVRPYDWEAQGKTGRAAYLQSIRVVQNIDRFAAQMAADEYPCE